MFVVSFYSFKGGVGRTVTLLNAAWHLARRGSRVALLDLDLEAPGLHQARLRRSEQGDWQPPVPRLGFSELVHQFAGQHEASSDWVSHVAQGLGPEGRIALLAARGNGDPEAQHQYESFVQTFSWAEFYLEANGRGFMEGLVRGVAGLGYDYLFLDARTGLTDVAGITLLHLPDLVVLVTNLSDQSVEGIKTQLAAIEEVNRECQTQKGSQNRRTDRRNVPISVVLVGSPLPRGELISRQARLDVVKATLGRPLDIEVDYLPLLALEEENHILAQKLETRSDELLLGATRPYERLVQEIVARNPEAPENLLSEGEELNRIGRWREALAHFDEVQDRYGERGDRGRIFWDALLHKMRAQLQALNVVEARKSLDLLEKELLAKEPRGGSWVDRAEMARGHLASSWASVILNRFDDARDDASRAAQLLERSTFQGPERYALLADCRFFLGQAHCLCSDWERACRVLEGAAKLCAELGTRPLLECLALAELARARLFTSPLIVAKEAIDKAWARAGLDKSSAESDRLRSRRIASTYVRARLLQARAEVVCEQGDGPAALRDLHHAFDRFHRDGDEVARIETAVTLAALDLQPPASEKNERQPALWEEWKTRAQNLRMPRVSVRLDLLRSVRGLALSREQELGPLPEQDESLGPVMQALIRLESCRRILRGSARGEGENAAGLLAQARADIQPHLPQREVEHELALLTALWEIKEGGRMDGIHALRRHADDLRGKQFWLREAQARIILALFDPRSEPVLWDLQRSLDSLREPKTWYWNLPVAFIQHAPQFTDCWRLLRPHLEPSWPQAIE